MTRIVVTDTELDDLEFRIRSIARTLKRRRNTDATARPETIAAMIECAAALRGLSVAMDEDVFSVGGGDHQLSCKTWEASDSIR